MIMLESILIALALGLLGLYFILSFTGKAAIKGRVDMLPALASLLLLGWVVLRSIITGHAPFSGAYESIVFFMFLFTLKVSVLFPGDRSVKRWLVLPVLLFLGAGLLLNPALKAPNLLVPALQSPWMFIHVPAFFMGYVSLTFSFVLALLMQGGKSELASLLDGEMKLSFFFISLGIVTGAFWGEQAWGHFWNWDNKEVWALITWLICQVYFHVRSPRLKFWVVMGAFAALLFTYFGVMFLLPGLHSYR